MATRSPKKSTLLSLGFGIGLLAAFLGIGGGVLVVPLLVFGFGLGARRATGTSLGVVFVVVSASVAIELLFGHKDAPPAWLAALAIAPASMLTARLVAPLVKRIPQAILRRGFAVVLLIAASRLAGIGPLSESTSGGVFEYAELGGWQFLILPIFGVLVGAVAVLAGIGGGMLLIPGLDILFSDLSPLSCRATSLLVVLPTAFVGFRHHLAQGTADASLVFALGPSCALGSIAGSLLVHEISADWFPRAFAVFLILAGLRLLFMSSPGSESESSSA